MTIARGLVLDVCTTCARITPFVVMDRFAPTLLGSGSYLGATRICRQCRSSWSFSEDAYDDVMALSTAHEPDAFDRLLRGTNTRLASILEMGNRLRRLAKEPAYRAPAGEIVEVLPKALELLEGLFLRGYDVRPYFDGLSRWDELDETERRELLDALRALAPDPSDDEAELDAPE